jgi:hypothetical protein
MSVITHRDIAGSSDSATASTLTFARRSAKQHFWRRTRALIKRAWGPLVVYAILALALIATVALRVAIWVPMYWH